MDFETREGKMDFMLLLLYEQRICKHKREQVISAHQFAIVLKLHCDSEPKMDAIYLIDSWYLQGYIDITDTASVPYLTDAGSRFLFGGGYSKQTKDIGETEVNTHQIKQSEYNLKKRYSEYTVAAFCYYFLMKSRLRPDYKSDMDNLQMDAVQAICTEANLKSTKKFQLKFNLLYDCSPQKLYMHLKRGDRQEILKRLQPHSTALLLAEKNLTNNEGNR